MPAVAECACEMVQGLVRHRKHFVLSRRYILLLLAVAPCALMLCSMCEMKLSSFAVRVLLRHEQCALGVHFWSVGCHSLVVKFVIWRLSWEIIICRRNLFSLCSRRCHRSVLKVTLLSCEMLHCEWFSFLGRRLIDRSSVNCFGTVDDQSS